MVFVFLGKVVLIWLSAEFGVLLSGWVCAFSIWHGVFEIGKIAAAVDD